MWDMPAEFQQQRCDCCNDRLTTPIFHYEARRYCSRTCFNLGTATQIGRPLFKAKPLPPGMTFLKARAR
jgi:hypothetical protein